MVLVLRSSAKKTRSNLDMSKGVWATDITVTAIRGFPLVSPGCDVVEVTLFCLSEQDTAIESGDIFVFTQKIVSKAEGRAVNLKNVNPGPQAKQLSSETGKDPRLVELILSESKEIVRQAPDLIVAAHRLGIILANAGIDHSNIESDDSSDCVLLLPSDPDSTSEKYREQIFVATGKRVGVAGLPAIEDHTGKLDLFGVPLVSSQEAIADELASAASLVQGQADEGRPVALIRGIKATGPVSSAKSLIRPKEFDLFR